MKKSISILFAALTAFSLMAFGYMNWGINKHTDLDLYYNVSNRWSTMTKEDLKNVKSILDIFREDPRYTREAYRNITVSILHNDKDVRDIITSEMSQSMVLNTAQLELLQSSEYSTNIRITALCRRTNNKTGVVENDSLVRYLTIIPEKEAVFAGGQNALIDYLKENSKEKVAIIREDKLQPGKVFFTVTKNGAIANVKIIDTSGYPSVDKKLVKIITKMPKKWSPATNLKGEKVDQEFVFFFGLEGC